MSYCENCGWKESECRCIPDDVPLQAAGQSPSLPPGSPSGVVEAAMKVFGDFTYEALRHHKERATKVKEFHAATNLIWDALRALHQAPVTHAAAHVEAKLRAKSQVVPALKIIDQEKGWDGLPVRIHVSNGKGSRWYYCKGHPMANKNYPDAPEDSLDPPLLT